MNPTVSIFMPCFNAAASLVRSIGSIQAQVMPDWELIVVDDGSTDGSWRILEELAGQDNRIRLLKQSNAGWPAARNAGMREGRGPYTAFLDSDDTWHPEFLSEMVAALGANSQAGIAYCGWQNIGLGGGRDKPHVPRDYEQEDKVKAFLQSCPWPIHGALVRSEIITSAGGFYTGLSSCNDYDLWLRVATTHRLVLVPRVLAFYHHHGSAQITSNKARIALNHLRAQQRYLASNPAVVPRIGREHVRLLTYGELLHRGYTCYWRRDLRAARTIFRAVMRHGYGRPRDWAYMLPAWLPESWHAWLLQRRDQAMRPADNG